MFIRYIAEYRDEYGDIQTGVFHACGYLCRSADTYEYDKKHLMEIKSWFNNYLEKPDRFSKSKRSNAQNVSLSWFKSTAIEHLTRMNEMKEVIERYDILVTVIKIDDPGYIIYEDDFQVSTLPYKNDRQKAL